LGRNYTNYWEAIKINKENVRKHYIEIRNELCSDEVHANSLQIVQKLNQLDCIEKAKNIMCYVSFGNEARTHELIKKWILEGKQVCVPYVVNTSKEDRCMNAVKIKSFDELRTGSYGILEPPYTTENIVSPDIFDVIIVPGSVFDINKNRMGFGAGYYDRFLNNVSKECCKLGICYDFQVLDEIPHDEFDVPLDILVTDRRIIL
jgi:5-formyltetrahydrofolate cyclo-ligase